ncbi:MAG TPA: sulfite exporter TauE/SafE family protein [Fibrobacteria bacterium]|nr:sulfite exporter TauE/SafE family protein [Fibrobacteria bacterium]
MAMITDFFFLRFGGALFPLAVGLGSSFTHCAGMCGPIHLFLASKGCRGRRVWPYHAGRITGYGLLGAALGALGHALAGLSSPGFRALAAGFLALVYALFGLGLMGWLPSGMRLEKRLGFLFPGRLFGRLSAAGGTRGVLFPAGLAASLLPCPSTHAVMLWSLGLDSAWKSALAMVLLGIGTLPVFAVIAGAAGSRPAWSGRIYQGLLGAAFLGLSAWRMYGIATQGPASCH